MIRLTGASCALLAFSVAIIRGLSVHNPPLTTLQRAIAAMIVFFALGSALGWIAQRVVREHAMTKEQEALAPFREPEETPDTSPDNDVSKQSENSSTGTDTTPIAT